MASLALIACLVFAFVIFSGPFVYLFSKIGPIPQIIKSIFSISIILICCLILFSIQIPIIQLFCFISIIFAWASLKTKKAH